ncbi:MAG: hypothetical protein LBC84_00360 [Prevotellaceae bacterium]|jgi:hypothetical protein|nr:hypothetical protein [Prevotellaceae bacterium]
MRYFVSGLLTLCALLRFGSFHAFSQNTIEALWSTSLDFFFDNREYNSVFNKSQTFFGQRIAPEVGVGFDDLHSVMVGAFFLSNYGARPALSVHDYIAYYRYQDQRFNCFAGLIPRSKSFVKYSSAFVNDSLYYYDPNISGLLLQYRGNHGYIELGVDWHSMYSKIDREKFLLFMGSQIWFHSFYAGMHANIYHFSHSRIHDGVVDNMLIYPHIGIDLSSASHFELFDIRAGWMQAFQNDRKYVGKYVFPKGLQFEIQLEKWRFGINNTFYTGQNLMPHWIAPVPDLDYGAGLYWGDPFYRTDSIYDRLEIYWQPHIGDRLSLRISTVHHYDGSCWSWQQKVRFLVNLGRNRW